VLPSVREDARVHVTLATGTHYVTRVKSEKPGTGTTYRFVDEDNLRSLPMPDGRWRSVYDGDGIVPGTERSERFLFWPMGIRSAGAMRQWGRHATAFVGRRHFDDADLIDRRFSIQP
jgi:hypothetical protein